MELLLHLRELGDPTAKWELLRARALCPGFAVLYEAAFRVTYPWCYWDWWTQSEVARYTELVPQE
jgi:hypothetical protein